MELFTQDSSKDFKKIKNNNELELYIKEKTKELKTKKIQYLLFHDVKIFFRKKEKIYLIISQ